MMSATAITAGEPFLPSAQRASTQAGAIDHAPVTWYLSLAADRAAIRLQTETIVTADQFGQIGFSQWADAEVTAAIRMVPTGDYLRLTTLKGSVALDGSPLTQAYSLTSTAALKLGDLILELRTSAFSHPTRNQQIDRAARSTHPPIGKREDTTAAQLDEAVECTQSIPEENTARFTPKARSRKWNTFRMGLLFGITMALLLLTQKLTPQPASSQHIKMDNRSAVMPQAGEVTARTIPAAPSSTKPASSKRAAVAPAPVIAPDMVIQPVPPKPKLASTYQPRQKAIRPPPLDPMETANWSPKVVPATPRPIAPNNTAPPPVVTAVSRADVLSALSAGNATRALTLLTQLPADVQTQPQLQSLRKQLTYVLSEVSVAEYADPPALTFNGH